MEAGAAEEQEKKHSKDASLNRVVDPHNPSGNQGNPRGP